MPHKALPGEQNSASFEDRLGYSFRNPRLLNEALTHKSFFHENRDKVSWYNERLEFLGDSVIGLIIVEHLFRLQEQFPEAVLAKIKSHIVSEHVLADVAHSLSLGKFLLLGKGEAATGGRKKKSILADALEAVFGAVYLDGGYERARDIFLSHTRERVTAIISSGDFFDYKTELQELSQTLFGGLPEYKVIREQGEEHKRIFTVAVFLEGKKLGVASGTRKKEAETLAAQKALEKIGREDQR